MENFKKYRLVTRRIGFLFKKDVIIVQEKIRGMTYSGYVEDIWVDVPTERIVDVGLDLLFKSASINPPPTNT